MVSLKTEEQIQLMTEGGHKLKEVMDYLLSLVRPGIKTEALDYVAEEEIRKRGAEPSFKRVPGYRWTICIPINEQIVHTPPSGRKLKEGDIVTIDVGAFYKGFHTDYAETVVVGSAKNSHHASFLKTGQKALEEAIKQAKAHNRIGHISKAIQSYIEKEGYHVIFQLTGHGVGKDLHEDPFIPGYLDRPLEKTLTLSSGMTLAIEVIYSQGTSEIEYEKNNKWSIVTKDMSLSACFEKTIAITDKNTLVLT